MQTQAVTSAHYRAASLLYLAIILLGLTSEVMVRVPLSGLAPDDLVLGITAGELPFRLSIAADTVMVVADIALAGLLFLILAPASRLLAGLAALFRLVQAATIAGNLSHQQAALAWALEGEADLAATAMHLHAAGYDNGLIFFGVNALLTGWLLVRHGGFPRWLAALMGMAGVTYLVGSYLRILAPEMAAVFQPAYLIAVGAEVSFAVTLFWRGVALSRRALEV